MIDQVSPPECCICAACANVCPKQAIAFTKPIDGFFYPRIDADVCIGCNLSEKVCPVLNPYAFPIEKGKPEAFAARSTDPDTRQGSTSGAVFYEAGRVILSHGGYVCGAVFDDEFRVKHIITDSEDGLCRMRGSKYAQSDVGDTYIQIKQILERGAEVLFCGCPCQVAALRRVLGKEYPNLFLLDFVCHGIPSQSMLDAYILEQEQRKRAKVTDIRFRDKARGWHNSSVVLTFDNGRIYSKSITVDPYMRGFHSGTTMRENCYNCRFKGFTSGSDLMLGDFWGAETVLKDWDDNTGISAVMASSEKGLRLLEQIPAEKRPVDLDCIIRYNKNILHSTEKSPIREQFREYAGAHGDGEALMHFFAESGWERHKRVARYRLRCIVYKLSGRGKPLY